MDDKNWRLKEALKGRPANLDDFPFEVQLAIRSFSPREEDSLQTPYTILLNGITFADGNTTEMSNPGPELSLVRTRLEAMAALDIARQIMQDPKGAQRLQKIYENGQELGNIPDESFEMLKRYGVNLYEALCRSLEAPRSFMDSEILYGVIDMLLAEPAHYSFASDGLLHHTFLKRGIPVHKNPQEQEKQVALCSGSSILLSEITMQILLDDRSKSVLIPEGYFESLVITPYSAGGRLTTILAEGDGYKLSAKHLEEALKRAKPGTYACLILTNPTNPMGLNYTAEELKDIGRIAVEHGIKILMDEQYAGLNHPGKQPYVSMASLSVRVDGKTVRLFDHVITVQGSSKIMDYEDTKISAACCGDTAFISELKQKIEEVNRRPNYVEAIEIGMLSSLIDPERNQAQMGHACKKLKMFLARANKAAGQEVFSLMSEPESGFYAVLAVPAEIAAKAGITSHRDFYLYNLLAADVKGRSIQGMGFQDNGKVAMRINFCSVEEHDLKTAFQRLGVMAADIVKGTAPQLEELRDHAKSQLTQAHSLADYLRQILGNGAYLE